METIKTYVLLVAIFKVLASGVYWSLLSVPVQKKYEKRWQPFMRDSYRCLEIWSFSSFKALSTVLYKAVYLWQLA